MSVHDGKLPYRRVYTGMPVYNGEEYLEQSIRCNLKQTYDDFGLIVADNASTDRTEEICRDIAATEPRLTYIRNPENVGAARNYERCFSPANSEYFRWSNGDDLIEENLIAQCVQVLDQHQDVVLAYGKTRLIDSDGTLIRDYDDNLNLSQERAADRFMACRENIGLSNVLYGLMRREALAKTSLFGNYVASDINLIAELTLYGKFWELPETLFSRRMHEQSSSADRHDKNLQKNFWDPSKRRLFLQVWRRMVEYYKCVSRSEIPSEQKRELYRYLGKTVYWKKGELLKEFADYVAFGFLRRS